MAEEQCGINHNAQVRPMSSTIKLAKQVHLHQDDPDNDASRKKDRTSLLPRFFARPCFWKRGRHERHVAIFVVVAGSAALLFSIPELGRNIYQSENELHTGANGAAGFYYYRGLKWKMPGVGLPNCYADKGSLNGIDLPCFRLSFGQAKAIDLAWNWILGRGLQAVLGFLAYRILTDGLMRAAEEHKIDIRTFTTLALFPTNAMRIIDLPRAIWTALGWRVRALLAWCLVSVIFLFLLPSLADLASGYDGFATLTLTLPKNGTLQLDNSVSGGRMNSAISIQSTLSTMYTVYDINNVKFTGYSCDDPLTSQSCGVPQNIHWHYSALQEEWNAMFNDSYVQGFGQAIKATPDGDVIPQFIYSLNNFYLADGSHYQCVMQPASYSWGFTFQWLRVWSFTTGAWLVSAWIFWVDADHSSQFCRKGRRMGTYRAIVDLGELLRTELGTQIGAYSETPLARGIKKVGRVKYHATDDAEDGRPPHIGLSTQPSARVKIRWGKKYC